jgi:hypothetical protein
MHYGKQHVNAQFSRGSLVLSTVWVNRGFSLRSPERSLDFSRRLLNFGQQSRQLFVIICVQRGGVSQFQAGFDQAEDGAVNGGLSAAASKLAGSG